MFRKYTLLFSNLSLRIVRSKVDEQSTASCYRLIVHLAIPSSVDPSHKHCTLKCVLGGRFHAAIQPNILWSNSIFYGICPYEFAALYHVKVFKIEDLCSYEQLLYCS